MIIRCEELQNVCSKILAAVDVDDSSMITETLAIYTEGNKLYLAVTNREYFVKVKLDLQKEFDFKATVPAEIFLKLISKMTTETVEFEIDGNSLIVKGNGTYKLPMIFNEDSLLELPEIVINTTTAEFDVKKSILSSILTYNSKELSKRFVVSNPVQKMYYLDEKGCITFTTGACVNNFDLNTTVKMLLPDKIVKLFKLFKEETVHFIYGKDTTPSGAIQTKIKLVTDTVELTAIITSDDSMINIVPADAIRSRAFDSYDYSIVVNKQLFIDAIDRILIFVSNAIVPYGTFEFKADGIEIRTSNEANTEKLIYENKLDNLESYIAVFDLAELKLILSGMKSNYVTINFGNHQAIVLNEDNIYNVVPECVL